ATFDLLAPAYAYKLDWADGSVAVGDFAHGVTLAGRAYVGVYLARVRGALKAAVEAWPRAVARVCALRRLVLLSRDGQAETRHEVATGAVHQPRHSSEGGDRRNTASPLAPYGRQACRAQKPPGALRRA